MDKAAEACRGDADVWVGSSVHAAGGVEDGKRVPRGPSVPFAQSCLPPQEILSRTRQIEGNDVVFPDGMESSFAPKSGKAATVG